MTKLQKRARSAERQLPAVLQVGRPSASLSPPPSSENTSIHALSEPPTSKIKPNSSTPLSPFRESYRRASPVAKSSPTHSPLIDTSSPPSVPYPSSPHHDASSCGPSCVRCGKKKLIQLNSPPSQHIPNTAALLRPVPQAHMRAVSDGALRGKGDSNRLNIVTTPAGLPPAKFQCCQKCGKQRRPASVPGQGSSSSQHTAISSYQRQQSKDYQPLRAAMSGAAPKTPHPSNAATSNIFVRSRSPSPLSPEHSSRSTGGEHIISPLSPQRRKVGFALPSELSNSSSGASRMPYTPLSPSEEQERAEIGTGRLINLISTAIRETSPKGLFPTDESANDDVRAARLNKSRSPVDSKMPFQPVELDSVPIGDTTADIINSYGDDEKDFAGSRVLIAPSTNSRPEKIEEENSEWAEYGYDWTDAISIPVIRLPSVKEGLTRFKSLRGRGNQGSRPSLRKGPSVRERFGSLRGTGKQGMQQQGPYSSLGGSGSKYQALGSSLEVGIQ